MKESQIGRPGPCAWRGREPSSPLTPLPPKTNETNESKTKRSAPFLSSCHRRRSGSLLPLLLLLSLSCWPACLRLGTASAHAYKDVDSYTPAPSYLYIGPGWDAASGPGVHLLLPLPFPFLPFHLPPSLLRFTTGEVPMSWAAVEPERSGRLALHAWSASG
jgi:hypothetical protein